VNIQEEVEKQVAKKVLAQIDTDKLAAKIAPAIEKAILSNMLKAIKELDWCDMIYNSVPENEIGLAIKKKLRLAIKDWQ
jgi:3-hydroxyacyl-CoA dehydrogenase